MYQIKRQVIDVSKEEDIILEETINEYPDLATAIFELNKARKADRGLYRIALGKVTQEYMCDDWHCDTSYMFKINNTCIECGLVNAEEIALKMYRLEG